VIAIIPVRAGTLPLGGDEAVAEAGGTAIVVGEGAVAAAAHLAGIATSVTCIERRGFAPDALARGLAPLVGDHVVVLPAGPDGRDLAPRLARRLDRPLLAGTVSVRAGGALVARQGGRLMQEVTVAGPFVATLQPGVRGVAPGDGAPVVTTAELDVDGDTEAPAADPELLEVLPADPATMDLGEAPRILGAGVGLGSREAVALLGIVAGALGASVGGTRVVTDLGWLPFERQIGTTGVTVDPELYLAFGISGAVQHVSGLGQPDHVIAVNLDESCPMMAMADLAVVTDAAALVAALARRLQVCEQDVPASEGHHDG
jgi:electron transfer flavoprotein alpha subunit